MPSTIPRTITAILVAAVTLPANTVTIEVTPTPGPNRYGSPYWSTWVSNAYSALDSKISSFDDPATPGYYEAISSAPTSWAVVTGFPSWNGQTDPGAVFGSAYANEDGRKITFGLRILTDGDHALDISQLSLEASSNDPGKAMGFRLSPDSFSCSPEYVRLNYCADRTRGGGDDFWVTSGVGTQLVDALFSRAPGNSFAAYCDTTCTDVQAALDEAALFGPYAYTAIYNLPDDSAGPGTFDATVTPEPVSLALLTAGLCLIIAKRRR